MIRAHCSGGPVSNVAIVTDSTAAMPDSLVKSYQIQVAPQVVIWNDTSYEDGIDITSEQFYARLATDEKMPTTSQATVASFEKAFEPMVAAGRSVLAVVVSDQLSGSYQSAVQAKEMFPGANIEVFNSETVAMALGFQVVAAARVASEGGSLQAALEAARLAHDRTGLLIVVDTLEFLHRGGRIGGAAHLLGTALNLKPLLEVRDGRVEAVERVRTRTKALARLLDILEFAGWRSASAPGGRAPHWRRRRGKRSWGNAPGTLRSGRNVHHHHSACGWRARRSGGHRRRLRLRYLDHHANFFAGGG